MKYIAYHPHDGQSLLLRKSREKDRPHNYERIAAGTPSSIVELASILNDYEDTLGMIARKEIVYAPGFVRP